MKDAGLKLVRGQAVQYKQRGAFTVELAFILMMVSGLFWMQINNLMAVSNKGKLDRLSYSLVNILSERRQLFGDEGYMCKDRRKCHAVRDDLYKIATASMGRMSGGFKPDEFGMRIEELRKEGGRTKYEYLDKGNLSDCNLTTIQSKGDILPKTSRNRYLPMYNVILCYSTPADLIGAKDNNMLKVVSSSFTYARI